MRPPVVVHPPPIVPAVRRSSALRFKSGDRADWLHHDQPAIHRAVGAALRVSAFVLAANAGGFRGGLLLIIAVNAGAFACIPALPAHSLHGARDADAVHEREAYSSTRFGSCSRHTVRARVCLPSRLGSKRSRPQSGTLRL
jgi:hypothetical protein